jgi:hypothetical protein
MPVISYVHRNSMIVNKHKSKEMLIDFGTIAETSNVLKIIINGKGIEQVDHFKLLGVNNFSACLFNTCTCLSCLASRPNKDTFH